MSHDSRASTYATQLDVARMAGVHRATVSRALDPARRDLVDSETVTRILAAVEQLGYRPNALARGLKTRRSRITGLIVPSLFNPVAWAIAGACEEHLRDAGFSTLLMSSDDDPETFAAASAQLMASRAEGVIVVTGRNVNSEMPLLELDDTPVVFVGPWHGSVTTVSIDYQQGAEAAVEHLIRSGHTSIGMIYEGSTDARGTALLAGYRAALDRAGIRVDDELVRTAEQSRPTAGLEACVALLDRPQAPTAILATSDETALGCYAAVAQAGLVVPADISVVGYGDSSYGRYFSPPLTTVSLPLADAGREAAAQLLAQLDQDGDRAPQHRFVAPRLVERQSIRRL